MLVKDCCSNHDDSNSKLEKCCVVENERTMRTESENAERQRVEGQVKSVQCSNDIESRNESGNVAERAT